MAEDKNKEAANAASNTEKELVEMKEKVATLEAENKELKAEIKKNEDELKDAADIVKDLKQKVNAAKGSKVHTIKIGGDVYKVVGGFRKGDQTYKPEDIASNEKIAKELLEKGSGLIKKVN